MSILLLQINEMVEQQQELLRLHQAFIVADCISTELNTQVRYLAYHGTTKSISGTILLIQTSETFAHSICTISIAKSLSHLSSFSMTLN